MNKILVPYDFSEYADHALVLALQLAQATQAHIQLVHVIEYPTHYGMQVGGEAVVADQTERVYISNLVDRTLERLETIGIDPEFGDVLVSKKALVGKPFESIAEEIAKAEADLVVMGTKGASGLKEFFVGSITEKVVRFADCPVITVPAAVTMSEIRRIVLAVNFEDNSSEIVAQVKQCQQLFGASLNMLWVNTLHVLENNDLMKERLKKFASENGLENFTVHTPKAVTIEEGILHHAKENDIDMIAMATHGYRGLTHLFLGSVAEDVVNHAQVPVWTCRLKKK